MSEPATETQTDTPPTDRLVIRIKLVTEEEPPPPPPPARGLSKGALVLIGGVVAVVLGWFSIGSLRSDPPPPPAVTAVAPLPKPVKPVEHEQPPQAETPPSTINEVVPDVPQSALDTIRGAIKVVIRVTLDKQGTVVASTTEKRGPSRYFERLSREAAKKWTFTPAKSEDHRTMRVQFNFTRAGATANASPVQ